MNLSLYLVTDDIGDEEKFLNTIEEAIKVFEAEKGKSFEPCIAEAVVSLKDEIITIDRDFKTFEGAMFDDELARWRKYHPELEKWNPGSGIKSEKKKTKGGKSK